MNIESEAGLIHLVEGLIEWSNSDHTHSVAVREVAVIGEWNDDNELVVDPLADRLVFVSRDGAILDIPRRAAGLTFVYKELSATLQGEIAESQFLLPTQSRVVWPAEIAGETLFDYAAVESNSLFVRIALRILPRQQVRLSQVVTDYLERIRENKGSASELGS